MTLQVYQLAEGKQTVIVPTLSGGKGSQFEIERKGNQINVSMEGTAKTWRILLVGKHNRPLQKECTTQDTAQGVVVMPEANAVKLTI